MPAYLQSGELNEGGMRVLPRLQARCCVLLFRTRMCVLDLGVDRGGRVVLFDENM